MSAIIIALTAAAVLIGGPMVYFLSSPDREVSETFSSFSFKNDAVERPAAEGEEDGYGEDEPTSESAEEWEWQETEDASGTGNGNLETPGDSYADAGSSAGTPSGSTSGLVVGGGSSSGGGAGEGTPKVAEVPETSPGAGVPAPRETVSPGTAALSVTSPQGGNKLINKSCPTNSETVCYESPIATIFWSYGDPTAKITIVLTSKSGTVRTLATKTSNSGRYTWGHMPTLPDGEYKLTLTAYSASGATLSSAETGFFTVTKEGDAKVTPVPTEPAPTLACPPVPSKVRTYTRANLQNFWSGQCTGTTCLDQVTLKHYRYPETVEIGESLSFLERCALVATPGTFNCPYTGGIYGDGNQVNTYSILTRSPDPNNNPNLEGDAAAAAYLKPIIGPSRTNDAFDMSIPFKIKTSEEGETYDFHWHPENQNIILSGQFSVSECEGDYSERSVWTSQVGDIWNVRAAVLATDGLEGAKHISGNSMPILALKTGKTYYLNIRWVKSSPTGLASGVNCLKNAAGTCVSPFVHTDILPDDAVHDSSLGRQFRNGPNDDALEFYRWSVYQYNFGSPFKELLNENTLVADPLFDRPGGVVLNPYLYYPSCNAIGLVHNGIRGSDCKIVCNEGYVVDQAKGWCVKE